MNNINGLSAKEFMEEFASRSKKIFNPAIPQEGSSLYGIKVVTDISDDVEDILTFIINGLSVGNSYKEILSTVGFANLTDENKFCAANLATSRIIKAGADSESNKLILYFIHDNVYESVELNKVGIEIFVQQDNKNHAVEVSYLTEEEYESIESELEPIIEGEIDSHFSFSINTGENIIHITNGSDIVEPIDYIANAKNADSLNNDISISVNSGVSNPQITGSGSIDGGDLTGNLNLSVNTQPIVQDILNNLLIPVASSTTLGGINIAGNAYTFTDPEYPIKLKSVNNKNYAYVDLTDFAELQQQDIHRYTNMDDATVDHPNLGEIVQYIGDTTVSYTHGYFYMRVRELIQGQLAANTNWQLTSPATGLATLNAAITEYNKLSDHLLVMSQALTLTPVDSTITSNTIDDNTVFNVVNGNFTDTLTYADIKEWGISLATLVYDNQHPELFVATITLSYIDESNPPVWILKNVLPPINVPAALVYKGVCTWAELEAKTLISKPGDFYTISDKANQEYFFNGTITSNWEDSWEYMGEVITIPEYTAGDHITITNYEIAADGLQEELSLGQNIDINNNVIQALGYKWDIDKKSFAEGKFSNSTDTPAKGSYSHTEGRETKTQGQASHAEGYNTIAEGKASHAEGFGILCNTSNFSWEYTASHNATIKIIISESKKTNLTLANEFYFANLFDFVEKSIYSRATKQQDNFSIKYIGVNNGEIEFDPTPGYYDDTDVNQITVYLAVDTSIFLDEGETFDIIIPVYANELAAHAEGKNTYAQNKNSHTEGLLTQTLGENSHAEGHLTFINGDGYNAHAEGYNTRAMKNQAHSEGANTQAYGENSHVEGEEVCAWGKDSHAEGKSSTSPALYDNTYFDDSLINVYNEWTSFESDDDSYSCAWGNVSHVEGKNNLALGNNSHAEGQGTCAYGDKSHAEGSNTLAKDNNSHAEGDKTKAIGFTSHAEGTSTTANGGSSHVEGIFTVTNNLGEHAEGKYNVSHNGTIHSIGIGNSILSGGAKNAFEVMDNGDAYLYGIGSYLGTSITSPIKSLQTVISELLSTAIPIGSIQMYAGSIAPTGWLLCNGSAISRSSYADLFTVIGTTYGTGDGSTTFNLPDLSGRFPLGVGESIEAGHTNHLLANSGGEEKHTLIVAEMPSHSHEMLQGGAVTPDELGEGVVLTTSAATVTESKYRDVNNADTNFIKSTGTSMAHNNMPPFLTLNFIIKY